MSSARRVLAPLLLSSAIALSACLPPRASGGLPGTAEPGQSATPSRTGPLGPTLTPSFVPPTPTPAPTFFVVTVARGDSLNTIAHKYGTTARSIAFWNRTTYPSLDPESDQYKPGLLQVGWTLYLLPDLVIDEDTGEPVDPSGALPAP